MLVSSQVKDDHDYARNTQNRGTEFQTKRKRGRTCHLCLKPGRRISYCEPCSKAKYEYFKRLKESAEYNGQGNRNNDLGTDAENGEENLSGNTNHIEDENIPISLNDNTENYEEKSTPNELEKPNGNVEQDDQESSQIVFEKLDENPEHMDQEDTQNSGNTKHIEQIAEQTEGENTEDKIVSLNEYKAHI